MHVGTSKGQGPPLAQSDPGAAPDPNDEEHMDARSDQEEMEEAINNFLLWLEKQEKKSFKDLATILIKAGFLSALYKDTADMFILLELRLYQHAQDHRSNWDIQG